MPGEFNEDLRNTTRRVLRILSSQDSENNTASTTEGSFELLKHKKIGAFCFVRHGQTYWTSLVKRQCHKAAVEARETPFSSVFLVVLSLKLQPFFRRISVVTLSKFLKSGHLNVHATHLIRFNRSASSSSSSSLVTQFTFRHQIWYTFWPIGLRLFAKTRLKRGTTIFTQTNKCQFIRQTREDQNERQLTLLLRGLLSESQKTLFYCIFQTVNKARLRPSLSSWKAEKQLRYTAVKRLHTSFPQQ